MIPTEPSKITDNKYRFDSFTNGKAFDGNKKGRLPAMGWNSWNAFGSGNTEALTKIMADKIVELGLDKLGYKYVVLDDGCYKSEREDGKLANEPVKFPSGFRALSDYVHAHGLKFGMYNDIGTNLCAGAAVGTCGFEATDARSYLDWGVDFLKIDNCYYLWDNATFSNPENAKYVFAPNLREIQLKKGEFSILLSAYKGILEGRRASLKDGYATGIGTFDGTNTGTTPVGPMSAELVFDIDAPEAGDYELTVNYATDRQNGTGEWLQVAAGCSESGPHSFIFFIASVMYLFYYLRQLLKGFFGEATLHLHIYHIGQSDGIVCHEPPGVITNGSLVVRSQVGGQENAPVGFECLGGEMENEVAPLAVHPVADSPHPS